MHVYPSCIIVNFMFKFMGITHIVAFIAKMFLFFFFECIDTLAQTPKNHPRLINGLIPNPFPANILSHGLLMNLIRKFMREFYFRD